MQLTPESWKYGHGDIVVLKFSISGICYHVVTAAGFCDVKAPPPPGLGSQKPALPCCLFIGLRSIPGLWGQDLGGYLNQGPFSGPQYGTAPS